jgi:Nif-specific regulatory protein
MISGTQAVAGPYFLMSGSNPHEGKVQTPLLAEDSTEFKSDDAPLARDASALLRINVIASLIQHLYASQGGPAQRPLQRTLFDLLFDLVPADEGAMLLFADSFGMRPQSWSVGESEVDPSLIKKVTRERTPVAAYNGAARLAIPMVLADAVLGVIYLSSADEGRRFSEQESQVMTAVAGIAALALKHARDLERMEFLQAENQRLREALRIEHSMIGESVRMQQLYKYIGKVARGGSTVLIRGESGTGKELVARAIHKNSPRAGRPFVAINCAAVTDTLLESEFFGHEKGAFTGAIAQKKGKLEVADGGTVFLDEIGELAPGLQAKLLRVLQQQEFERVGGTRPIKIDVRVVAATNRDLEAAIKDGGFRPDLYYRLNVVTLEVPALRERREDIPALANFFAQHIGKARNRPVQGVSRDALKYLTQYDWPGNVRELENAIERAVVLGSADVIEPDDLPESILEVQPDTVSEAGEGFHESVTQAKKKLILSAVEKAGGNITEAARILQIHPNHLHRLVTNLGLREHLD